VTKSGACGKSTTINLNECVLHFDFQLLAKTIHVDYQDVTFLKHLKFMLKLMIFFGVKLGLEALFAALRPHDLCPRTWNRAPTPSVARGHAQKKI